MSIAFADCAILEALIMDPVTQADLLALGVRLAAVGLILGAGMLLISGAARPLGSSLRLTIEPILCRIRDRTALSRSELADASTVVAVVLAAGSALVERSPVAVLVAGGLWLARPSIRRVTREENRMLAIAGYFSIDLMIGLYTPIMLAQFLIANLLLGGCLLSVVVALSWPAGSGGSSIPGRRWHLAPVAP